MSFPKYAFLSSPEGERNCAMKHRGSGIYYRDAGCWELRAVEKNGKIIVTSRPGSSTYHLKDWEMVECTEKEWKKSNAGYV